MNEDEILPRVAELVDTAAVAFGQRALVINYICFLFLLNELKLYKDSRKERKEYIYMSLITKLHLKLVFKTSYHCNYHNTTLFLLPATTSTSVTTTTTTATTTATTTTAAAATTY